MQKETGQIITPIRNRRRGVALLVALTVAAVLFIMVGGLIAGLQITEGTRARSAEDQQLFALERLALDSAQALIRSGTDTGKWSIESEPGTAVLRIRSARPEEDAALYKNSFLSVRDSDKIVRIDSPQFSSSIWIVNTAEDQARRICVQKSTMDNTTDAANGTKTAGGEMQAAPEEE